jgi:ubiquinone/menaquinone biosynthesis C-methylase UbiE
MSLSNVEVREGFAEALPVEDRFADVIISNGVVNLCPDKRAVFGEMLRVLKPGGRMLLEQTGFTDIVMSNEVDVFSGSKHESDAKEFDTRGVTVYAVKPR